MSGGDDVRLAMIAAVIVATLAGLAGAGYLWLKPAPVVVEQDPSLLPLPLEARASRFGEYWAEVFVIDLGQPGIQLLAPRSGRAAFFDMDNDGFAEFSGWVAPDDGILAIDLDGDGRITNYSELLGGGDKSGFGALNWLDSDRNGTIDQFDRDYHRLYVWRDLNGDGLSSPNELIPLGRSQIRIIPLRARAVNETIALQKVVARGPVYIAGSERDMVAVNLAYDNTISRDDRPLGTFDTTILSLPELRGYGRLANLQRAMNDDKKLHDMVRALKDTAFSELLAVNAPVEDKTREILYRWGRVDELPRDRRGMADSRMLEWIEEYRDEEYRQGGIAGVPNPTPDMQARIAASFTRTHTLMTGKLLAQTQLGALFTGLRYNAARDVLEGYRGIDAQRLNQVKWIASQSNDPPAVWQVVMLMVNAMGEQVMSSADRAMLVAAIAATAPKTSFDALMKSVRERDSAATTPVTPPTAAPVPAAPAVAAPPATPTAPVAAPAAPTAAPASAGGGNKIRRVGSGN